MISQSGFSQVWQENVPADKRIRFDANFYEQQKTFNAYWSTHKRERSKGWKQFKRWESFWAPRVYPTGNMQTQPIWSEYMKNKTLFAKGTGEGNWTEIAMPTVPPSISTGENRGVGRVNCIAFHPTNPNIMWIGSPSGGVWKTTDGCQSWYTTTDNLPYIGISDIAVDTQNPDILYAATGDMDGQNVMSIGVLKSTDGGETWDTTGLQFDALSNPALIKRVVISPANSNVIFATTTNGLMRSSDAGLTWTLIEAGYASDIEFMPGNADVIYLSFFYVAPRIMKSVDNGLTFTKLAGGLPSSNTIRSEIAVTPANPNVVYALISNGSNGLRGIYKSVNAGTNWTKTNQGSANMLGWQPDGSDQGGQAAYDLALAVSPTDENELYIGGINIWKSSNGGVNWTLNSFWSPGFEAQYAHADQHIFTYNPQNVLFIGNDGGVYRNNNGEWLDVSAGINILQIYRTGTSATDEYVAVTGSQDNGTYLFDNGKWNAVIGGDGMECIVDYTNANVLYGTSQYGDIQKSSDRGKNFNSIRPTASTGAWITPYVMSKSNPNTLWAAYSMVYKTTDGGSSWSEISPDFGVNLLLLEVAPSNENYIFAGAYSYNGQTLQRTTDGGQNWEEIITGLPNFAFTYLAIDPTNEQRLWITASGNGEGEKVYYSQDAGTTWTNYSAGIPNISVNCIVYQNGSNDMLYIGTDLGVFYRNATMDSWLPYSNGLPNVIVNELEIQYASQRLRAATYGRGLWESDLYSDGTAVPFARMMASKTIACGAETITLYDKSAYNPQTWLWEITPATFNFVNGTSANSQNPEIQFTAAGMYSITLTVSNANGSSSVTKEDYIRQAPIIAEFLTKRQQTYIQGVIRFFDNSVCDPTTWNWQFTPNTVNFVNGTSANSQNPEVQFTQLGDYSVSLTVTNALGSDTYVIENYINVGSNYLIEDVTIATCEGTFYDAGGAETNYLDATDFVMTFKPVDSRNKLQFNFTSFYLENEPSCAYDYLKIYDGSDVTANLIGMYCGSNSPGTVLATNAEGSLTFKFHADGGVTDSGWVAHFECIETNQIPLAIAGTNQTVLEYEQVTLNASLSSDPDGDALTYLWTAPSGITLSSASVVSPTFTAPASEISDNYLFTLVVNDGKENSVSDSVSITVNNSTGITANENSTDIKIRPNPSKGVFDVIFQSTDNQQRRIEILSSDGRTVYSESKKMSQQENTAHINCSGLSKGIYLLKIISGKEIITKKIVIE